MRIKFIIGFIACIFSISWSYSQPLLLKPAISQDGSKIAFSYQGDIWTVPAVGGRADRITIHEGYESSPQWSQNGNKIAFNSDRYGNNDIFLINATGGLPQRLSHHSAGDLVSGFTPEGSILFITRRLYAQVEREWEIYEVKTDGSTPSRYMDALGFDPVVSPDGTRVAFVRGTCRLEREAYKGPANRNIWIYNKTTGDYAQITFFEGNDYNPKWMDNETLLYISSKSGKYNIHRKKIGGSVDQVTEESEFGINSFDYSHTTMDIVYQNGDQLAVYNLNTKEKNVPKINVDSDYRFDPSISKKVLNRVDEFAISPNGKLSAYIHRGDLFVKRNDKEDSLSTRITSGASRERDVTWLNDNTVLFVSDKNGQYDLFQAKSADPLENNIFKSLKHSVTPITNTKVEEFQPVVSPDGELIAFQQGRGRFIVAEISEIGKLGKQEILLDGWDSPEGVAWSPDSKWLAYSLSDLNFNSEIFIHAADNSKNPVNISMHPKRDSNPVWSPDGSKIGFISSRNNGDSDVWFAWLKKGDWEKNNEARKREKFLDDKEVKKENEEDEEKDIEPLKIDFDKIYLRLVQVTGFAGSENEFIFNREGDYIYYTTGSGGRQDHRTENNLYKIKWDGSDKKVIFPDNREPESLKLNKKGDYAYFLSKGGEINRFQMKDDKPESLNVYSQLTINYLAEREQILEEGWRALNTGFYDPGFHGRDWEALKEKYKPIILKASTKEDFQYEFSLMLGQLNASHMGIRSGDNQKNTQSQKTGFLGIEGFNVADGFKITYVLPGSPADKLESKLNTGDIITAVDQETVNSTTNFYSLLTDKANVPTLLEVMRSGKTKEEFVIWPVSSVSSELYNDWVDTRRSLVDDFSNGKLGYLHIRGMNWTSFERFERELMAAGYGKEGIVIDVRYNGGGWTTDYLMAVLNVNQHAYTIPRGAAENLEEDHLAFRNNYPFGERLPLASWTKPSITMCNENSYSNAEIFSHAYKANKLGTLVGKPTFGAVISTGSWGLVDGSYVRMPFRAWYVKDSDMNMEHGPAVPDIVVDNPPAYKINGADLQLKRAVEELLNSLEN